MSTTIINLLSVPTNMGADNLEVADGPAAHLENHFIEKLQSAGFTVNNKGEVPVADRNTVPVGDPKLRRLSEVVKVSEAVATITESAMHAGEAAVVLGGDHTTCLGAVSGAASGLQGTLGLIYFDAHGDLSTNQTTRSGNIHGMHLASLMGYGAPELAHVHNDRVKIQKEHMLHIGGCDFDQAELDLIKTEGLQAFTIMDLLTKGLGALLPHIDALAQRVDHLWISLDLDAIDALYAPAAGMPNKKGLTYREVNALAEYIGKTGKVVGVDVVEYNPTTEIDNKTSEIAIELTASFLGKTYSWYEAYMAHNQAQRED